MCSRVENVHLFSELSIFRLLILNLQRWGRRCAVSLVLLIHGVMAKKLLKISHTELTSELCNTQLEFSDISLS